MSVPKPLEGQKILIVEDEAFIAMDLEGVLSDAGAVIVGPVPDLEGAKQLAQTSDADAAILDIMLGREEVYPAADILLEREIPFIFHSAHADPEHLKTLYPTCQLQPKPSDTDVLVDELARMILNRAP